MQQIDKVTNGDKNPCEKVTVEVGDKSKKTVAIKDHTQDVANKTDNAWNLYVM